MNKKIIVSFFLTAAFVLGAFFAPAPANAQASSLWGIAQEQLGANASASSVMSLAKQLAQQFGIAVPEWGIPGSKDARKLNRTFFQSLFGPQAEAAISLSCGVATPSYPTAEVGVPYSVSLSTSTSTCTKIPYNLIVLSGSLPPGLIVTSNGSLISGAAVRGAVAGTPTTPGTYSFQIVGCPNGLLTCSGIASQGDAVFPPATIIVPAVSASTADLSIVKSAPETVLANGLITFTIDATNAGPDDASATVNDVLPTGTTFSSLSSPAGWSCSTPAIGSSGTVSCTKAAFTAGSSASFSLVVNAPASPGSISNTATISTTDNDPNLTNNTFSTSTFILGDPSVTLTKSFFPESVYVGQTSTMTFTLTNTNTTSISGIADVHFIDFFPAGLAIASPSGLVNTCSGLVDIDSDTFFVNVTLPLGSSCSFSVNVVALTPGEKVNTTGDVGCSAVKTPGICYGNPATATLQVALAPTADLSITKTDGVTSVISGSNTTYTITASNDGPNNASATVSDIFPAGLNNVTWTCVGAGGGACTGEGAGNINDSVFLPAGGSVTYSATATVVATGGNIVNTASVSATDSVQDPNPGNNSATDTDTVIPVYTIISSAGPNGTIIPSGSTTVVGGNNQSYTMTPNVNYHIDNVLVDNMSVGAVANYTFNNVQANHTISVTFAINDTDGDGTLDPDDECVTVSGPASTFGCPARLNISVQVVDGQIKPPTNKDAGFEARVYSANAICGATTLNALGFKPANFATIWNTCAYEGKGIETNSITLLGAKQPQNLRSELKGVGATTLGDHYALVESMAGNDGIKSYAGFQTPKLLQGETRNLGFELPAGKPNNFIATSFFTINSNGNVNAAHQAQTVNGSFMQIIQPDYVDWSTSAQIYPFIFIADSGFDVDVCLSVPVGYKIVAPGTCGQTFVDNEVKVLEFSVVDVGSPKVFDVGAKLKIKHKGKNFNFDLKVPSTNKKAKGN